MTDEKIEYHKGQIWLDTKGEAVIRYVTSPTQHTEFWPETNDEQQVYIDQPNSCIERYEGTLLYNPPVEWAVGDVVPAGTKIDRAWTAWNSIRGEYQTLNPDRNECFTFDATIVWIETKENNS